MIRIFLVVASILGALSIPRADAAEQTVLFRVDKMSCALCPVTVRKAMGGVNGVSKVDVDFEHKVATVIFDDTRTNAAEIARASTNAGYPATPTTLGR
jgi:mercuric ion binding protein